MATKIRVSGFLNGVCFAVLLEDHPTNPALKTGVDIRTSTVQELTFTEQGALIRTRNTEYIDPTLFENDTRVTGLVVNG